MVDSHSVQRAYSIQYAMQFQYHFDLFVSNKVTFCSLTSEIWNYSFRVASNELLILLFLLFFWLHFEIFESGIQWSSDCNIHSKFNIEYHRKLTMWMQIIAILIQMKANAWNEWQKNTHRVNNIYVTFTGTTATVCRWFLWSFKTCEHAIIHW